MRLIQVTTTLAGRSAVADLLRDHGAEALRSWSEGDQGMVDAALPNRAIGEALGGLSDLSEPTTVLLPDESVMTVHAERGAVESLDDPTTKSPVDVYLAARQSMTGWTGLIGYAAAAGAVVWVGLFLGSIPLVIASMLIAPFGGPAINTAVATARGDLGHLGRAVRRYLTVLAVVVATTAALHLALGGAVVTDAMTSTSKVSVLAPLIPLVGGAVGVLNITQSERASLVSAAATGILIAAALAPPAGLVGMAVVAREFDLATTGLFLLGLQLMGINIAGAAVLHALGLRPSTPGLERRRSSWRNLSLVVSVVCFVGLAVLQQVLEPRLQRDSVETRISTRAAEFVEELAGVRVVDIAVSFPTPSETDVVLIEGVVTTASDVDAATVETRIEDRVADAFSVRPVAVVAVRPVPADPASPDD